MTTTDRRRLFLRADGLFAVPGADGEGGDGGAPDPHAATHADGGSDEIAIAQSQVIGLETALAGKPDTGDPPTAHHATHEPGGSDPLANVAWTNVPNTFTVDQAINGHLTVTGSVAISDAVLPRVRFTESGAVANQRVFLIAGFGEQLFFQAQSDAGVFVSNPLTLDRLGNAAVAGNLLEKGRTVPLGHWQDVGYNAANFSAGGSMTWTVAAGGHYGFAYSLVGKTMRLSTRIAGTIGGTVGTELRIAIPGGFVAGRSMTGTAFYYDGTHGIGLATTTAGIGYVSLYKDVFGAATWQAGAATVYLSTLVFDVQ